MASHCDIIGRGIEKLKRGFTALSMDYLIWFLYIFFKVNFDLGR